MKGSMIHLISWEITPEDLEYLADELRKNPVISLKISENVELLIKRSPRLVTRVE